MPRRRYYIPLKDGDFFNFQHNLVNIVVANKTDWNIPDDAVTALVNRRQEYETLYKKASNKMARTSGDVLAHRQCRKIYEKEIRIFANSHIRYNDKMTDKDRQDVGVPPRDTKPSPRPKITDIPFIGLTNMGGGAIEVRCRTETDQTRDSMHPAADAIECRYVMIPIGEKPPNDAETCAKFQTSKKARFIISCGAKNEGQRFYGFFHWVNLTNPENSGPWSNYRSAVIA